MKLFLLIFTTSITLLFGQKLKFDVMAKYSISSEKTNSEISVYAISSNENYIMAVLNQYDGQQRANVYDLKSLKIHQFTIKESKSENDVINYKFIYSKTSSFDSTQTENIYFDFQNVSIEGDIETVKLIFYKNKSKTKILNTLELKIMKSEVNFFPLFRFACLHLRESIMDLNYDNGGLVINSTSENGFSKSILTAFVDVNIEITIPN